jgi:hypothetical protein
MDTELDPIIGNWYKYVDGKQMFRVVAFDEEQAVVKIQHFDGDIEDVDASAWFDMEIEPTETPEDWTGPLDEIEDDWPDEDKDTEWDDEQDDWDDDDSDEDT